MTIKETLIEKFKNREACISVLGLGYVGLPLAVIFAEAGFTVLGIDPDTRKVAAVDKGHSYIQDVSTEQLARLVKSGKFRASENSRA